MTKAYSPQDHYFHLAKKRGFRARSAFKLEEILEKFPKLLPRDANVLDLGAAPGSFLQVLIEKMKGEGKLIGVDLQKIEPILVTRGLHRGGQVAPLLLQGDIFSTEVAQEVGHHLQGGVQLLTADLAPKTSGVKDIDQWKSVELNQQVLSLCAQFLVPGGNLITKIFVGEDFQAFWKDEFQPAFQTSKTYKPKACRDRSFETYLIGQGFRGAQER